MTAQNKMNDSVIIGFIRKGTMIKTAPSKDSVKRLTRTESFQMLSEDGKDAVVLFSDSTFGLVENYTSKTAFFNIPADSVTAAISSRGGPRPPPKDPVGGGHQPIPLPTQPPPQVGNIQLLSLKEVQSLIATNAKQSILKQQYKKL